VHNHPCGDDVTLVPSGPTLPSALADPRLAGNECGLAGRLALGFRVERPFGRNRLATHTTLATATGEGGKGTPLQELAFLGGPVTGPGYRFHQFVGRFGASQRVEWRTPVPFPAISLGRYGRSPGSATLAPFAHTVFVADRISRYGEPPAAGWFPSLGVGAYVFFDLVRLDVARGLRDGRWTFSVDVTRDFWRVL
jgi:hypothetical protein